MADVFKVGDPVILTGTGIPDLDGREVVVSKVEEWGCHVVGTGMGTGQYRAAQGEMVRRVPRRPPSDVQSVRAKGYSGDTCSNCGGVNVRRKGTCLSCDDCSQSSGCD